MKIFFSIIFFFVLIVNIPAQEKIRKVHFGLSFTPQLNFTNFEGGVVIEENSFCYQLGGDVFFDLSSKFQFTSGIGAQFVTQRHKDYAPWSIEQVNGEPVFKEGIWHFNTEHLFISIPLGIKFKFSEKPGHLYGFGGVRFNMYAGSDGMIEFTSNGIFVDRHEPDDNLFTPSPFTTSIGIGFGYEKQFGKFKANLGPVLEYYVNEFFEEKVSPAVRTNGHLILIGLKAGVQM